MCVYIYIHIYTYIYIYGILKDGTDDPSHIQGSKGDTDVKNRLLDSVGKGRVKDDLREWQ